MAKHLRHMINKGGLECAAIGTDFDGIRGNLEVGSTEKMQELFVYLLNHGFTMNEVEHIAYKNARRVIREVL